MDNIGTAFTYMFDDPTWLRKFAIGGSIVGVSFIFIVSLVVGSAFITSGTGVVESIIGFALLVMSLIGVVMLLPVNGYMIEAIKLVRDATYPGLPEWSSFSHLFQTGLMLLIISLVYNIPAVMFACLGTLPSLFANQVDVEMADGLRSLALCLNCLQAAFVVAASFVLPAATVRYANTGDVMAAFQVREILDLISVNSGQYILVVVLSFGATLLSVVLGTLLCGLGLFFTIFWAYLVSAGLYGRLARSDLSRGDAASVA